MRSHLHRYVIAEILGPLTLGFLVYTFIMLVRFFFVSADLIISKGVALSVIGELLLYSLPNIFVLTLPMALLFGILTAIGRLASDSELTALRASGVSLLSLYRPILLLSALLTVANLWLTTSALPWGNTQLQRLQLDIMTESVAQQVEPRVFYEDWVDKVLYIFDQAPENGRWQGVFLAESLPRPQSEVYVADEGAVRVAEDGERVVLELFRATSHSVDLNEPDRYVTQRSKRIELTLEDQFTTNRIAQRSVNKGVRSMDLGELFDQVGNQDASDEVRRLAHVEIHKKFSIPGACLVFGLIALPLGFNNSRGSKASGFALSILVILVYYVLINNGEEAARYGQLPAWLAMWLPNLLLTGIGLFLLGRKNSDKSLLLSRVDRWIRQDLWRGLLHISHLRAASRQRRARRRPGGEPIRLGTVDDSPREEPPRRRLRLLIPRPRLRFPNLMDRYVLRAFGGIFVLVTLSGVSLYVIADLSELADEILKNKIPRAVVFNYYRYLSLQFFYDLAPIAVLITTLVTFSLLTRTNEITAAKALGTSLYRLSVPAILASMAIAALSIYLQSEVLPVTNLQARQLEDRIRDREATATYRRTDRWLVGQGGRVYNYLHYDPVRQSLQRLQVFEFGPDRQIARRLFAARARFQGDRWLFAEGWIRDFQPGAASSFEVIEGWKRVDFPETPDFFDARIRPPELMRYGELKSYIAELRASGQQVPQLEVELQNKIAFPLTCVVMALVALPFAFRLGRQGTLYGIGLSIILGMVFFGVLAFFSALGQAEILPPVIAVWAPGALFAIAGIYLFLGIRT